jgi:two-component sensor histidine kinase
MIRDLFRAYSGIGTQNLQKPWQISLVRKLNLLTFFGTLNITAGLLVFHYFNYGHFFWDCILVMITAPFVVLLNYLGRYILASYLFSIIGFAMFASLNLKMGAESFAFILYFPLALSTIQLFGRREMFVHLAVIFLVGFLSICGVLYGLSKGWMLAGLDAESVNKIRYINLYFGLLTTFLFVCIISYEAARQEKVIHNMLHEKEVLLAEVFHRVKNNMNIVTSLLNLKKNASSSVEVQEALEECRNRIFSMALVHQKIYSTKSFTRLEFKDYVSDLINALRVSIDGAQALIELECEKIELGLSTAIPCGLILNELITNSFKHASKPGQQLSVRIRIIQLQHEILLFYKDSGPGLPPEEAMKKNTLGLDIIRSLSEQLDAAFEFGNEKGFTFDMKFPVK